MNIIAAGMLTRVGAFLHAGYVSAYPRTLDPNALETSRPLLQLEVKEALRLQGETLVQAGGGTGAEGAGPAAAVDPCLAVIGSPQAWIAALAGTGLLLLALALVMRLRYRRSSTLPWLDAGILSLGIAAVTVLISWIGCANAPDPAPAPWEGVPLRVYTRPETATKVILYGLIADGLSNAERSVKTLPEIRDEIGFPNLDLSEGQKYALKTYGIDGWGTPFRLEADRAGGRRLYRVASAGPDLEFGTRDDLRVEVSRSADETWDENRWAFFIRREDAKTVVFYHRWRGPHFVYRDRAGARARTGSDLFDLAVEGAAKPANAHFHRSWKSEKADAVFDTIAGGAAFNPLVLLVSRPG